MARGARVKRWRQLHDEERTAAAFAAAIVAPPPKPPPPAAPLVRDVLRRAREQGDLDKPLEISMLDREAFPRFGIEVLEDPARFWCGTAPGWQRFVVSA